MGLTMSASGKGANHPYENDRRKIPKPEFGQAAKAINSLGIEKLGGGSKSKLVNLARVRIDRQNPPSGGGSNLQVQVNGMRGKSTIATLVIEAKAMEITDNAKQKKQQQATLMNAVRKAFHKSLESGNVMKLKGSQ